MPVHSPQRFVFSPMAAYSGKILLLDPASYPGTSSYANTTWIWNGATTGDWQQINATNTAFMDPLGPIGPGLNSAKLSGRINHICQYDGTNVIVYGGQGSSSTAGIFNDTWAYTPGTSTWALQTGTSPYGRAGAQAAYLSGTGIVMFGGALANGQMLNETWLWTHAAGWSQVSIANGLSPSARVGHVMAATSSAVIMFGGKTTQYQLNDVWSYASGVWTQLTLSATSAVPLARDGAAMCWDSVNSKLVLFGGNNATMGSLPQTYTGTISGTTITWTAINNVGPAGRYGATMQFDTTGNTSIMTGGICANNLYPGQDTWSFNASTNLWVQL
jgi:N-acetylneuraminic acid mutarotase